jgi:Zn-dependent peptidase ImmA (M78 family)
MQITFDPCQPLVVVPPAGITPAESQSLDDAIAMWHKVGMTQVSREESANAQHLTLRFQKALPAFFGIYLDKTGEVVVNTSLTDRTQRAITMAHEMGHAWGLFHIETSVRTSVMNKGNLTTRPLTADADAVLAHWGGLCADRAAQATAGN